MAAQPREAGETVEKDTDRSGVLDGARLRSYHEPVATTTVYPPKFAYCECMLERQNMPKAIGKLYDCSD